MDIKLLKKNAFIVSCQVLKNEELFGNNIMTKMAQAAINGGANYIRTSQIPNIKTMLKKLKNVPIIGLIKKSYPNSKVIITPTINELKKLIASKVHIITIDATNRQRPQESLLDLVNYFTANKQPHQLLMGDCSNEEDIKLTNDLPFDIIGTTLRGYTSQTKNNNNHENDFAFLKKARQITNKYLIAEGRLNTPILASQALNYVDAVVVGSAITRPKFITELFTKEIKKTRRKNDKNFYKK